MSKNLSEEYSKAVVNDLPDLWDKIEARIDEIDASAKEEKKEVESVSDTEVKQFDVKAPVKKKKSNIYKVITIVGSAAAAILLLTVASSLIFIRSDKNSTASEGREYVAPDMGFEATDEEGCVAYDESSYGLKSSDYSFSLGNTTDIRDINAEMNKYETTVTFDTVFIENEGEEIVCYAFVYIDSDVFNDFGELIWENGSYLSVRVEVDEILPEEGCTYKVEIAADEEYEAAIKIIEKQ